MAELDSFIRNITKLTAAVETLDKHLSSAAKGGGGAKGRPASGGSASAMSSSSGNLLANSFGFSAPMPPADPNRRSVRTAAFTGKDDDTDYEATRLGGVGRAFKKRGMAEARFASSDGSPLTGSDMGFNRNLAEREKDRIWNKQMGVSGFGGKVAGALGYQGITRQEFGMLPENAQNNIKSAMPTPQDSLNLMSGIQNATSTFLPQVGAAVGRATGYYNATLAGGNRLNRSTVTSATFDTMNAIGGISSVGSDANVAEYLGKRGMSVSGDQNSTYQQTVRATANAARYLNINNEAASASIEGLTSGTGSANMLRNFGIYTADLKTGKEKTQGQIFEELAQRLTAGRKSATQEQTQASIRRGALGATINSFFQGDEAGAQMFKQYMVDRAGGKSMDLSNEGAMQGLYAGQAGNNRNPLNAQMTMNSSATEALGMAQDEYIKGMEAAAGVITTLQKAAGAAAATLMGFPNALLQTLMGNQQVQGLVKGATAVSDYASKGIAGIQEAIINGDYTTPVGIGVVGASVSAIGAATVAGAIPAAASLGGQMLAGLGSTAAGALSGNATSGSGLVNYNVSKNGGGSDAVSSSSSSSLVTALAGVSGAGASGASSGGLTGTVADSTGTATGMYTSFKKPGDGSWDFGTKTDHGTTHKGIDYFMGIGTPVEAIADGVVQDVQTNHPQNDFGLDKYGGGASGKEKSGKSYSYGNWVKIYHAGGYVSLYAHLSEVLVKPGDAVTKGQVIGKSGMSGGAYGAHLHLQVFKAKSFSDKSEASSVDPSSLSVAQLVAGSNLGGSTLVDGSNAASGSSSGVVGIIGGVLDSLKPSGAAAAAIANLTKLSSGNSSDILSAIQSMGSGIGLSLSSPSTTAPLDSSVGSSTAAALVGTGASSSGNTFNFNISVPSVTETEAMKFAKLVQQYLDDNTLKTNTVRI